MKYATVQIDCNKSYPVSIKIMRVLSKNMSRYGVYNIENYIGSSRTKANGNVDVVVSMYAGPKRTESFVKMIKKIHGVDGIKVGIRASNI